MGVDIIKKILCAFCIFDFYVFRQKWFKSVCAAVISVKRNLHSADDFIGTNITLNPNLAQLHFFITAKFSCKNYRTIFKSRSLWIVSKRICLYFHWEGQGYCVSSLPFSADNKITILFCKKLSISYIIIYQKRRGFAAPVRNTEGKSKIRSPIIFLYVYCKINVFSHRNI